MGHRIKVAVPRTNFHLTGTVVMMLNSDTLGVDHRDDVPVLLTSAAAVAVAAVHGRVHVDGDILHEHPVIDDAVSGLDVDTSAGPHATDCAVAWQPCAVEPY